MLAVSTRFLLGHLLPLISCSQLSAFQPGLWDGSLRCGHRPWSSLQLAQAPALSAPSWEAKTPWLDLAAEHLPQVTCLGMWGAILAAETIFAKVGRALEYGL